MLSLLSHVRPFVTPWAVALLAPLSMGFSRQEYWSGLPCPPPGDLPGPGMEPVSLMSPTSAGEFFTNSTMWEALVLNGALSKSSSPAAPDYSTGLYNLGDHTASDLSVVEMRGLSSVHPSKSDNTTRGLRKQVEDLQQRTMYLYGKNNS